MGLQPGLARQKPHHGCAVTGPMPLARHSIDGLFSFETPTCQLIAFSITLVAAYAAATEFAKRLFFKGQGKRQPQTR